jgi:hypothetical protein
MVSERMRLRLERLLDEADAAADRHDWKACSDSPTMPF